jgi:Component of IIS longevity pathway SMK-1
MGSNSNEGLSRRRDTLQPHTQTNQSFVDTNTGTNTGTSTDATSGVIHGKIKTQHQPEQPDGWRVKLYRLNQDGSWDDCGTGRIQCVYENGEVNHQIAKEAVSNTDTNESTSIGGSNRTEHDIGGYATLCVHSELPSVVGNSKDNAQMKSPKVLLRTRILLQDTTYQRQGDNIITWYEPFYNNSCQQSSSITRNRNSHDGIKSAAQQQQQQNDSSDVGGVDLALSFQDNCGCLEIWQQIVAAQGRQVENVVAAAAAAQHQVVQEETTRKKKSNANKEEQPQRRHTGSRMEERGNSTLNSSQDMSMDSSNANIDGIVGLQTSVDSDDSTWDTLQQHHQHFHNIGMNDSGNDHCDRNLEQQHYEIMSQQQQQQQQFLISNSNNTIDRFQLPSPPSTQNIDDIADTIASLQQQHHMHQRELLSLCITVNDCLYYKQLLDLFYVTEAHGNYGKLATLAACIKTVLLLNDPTILELTITDETIFDRACACLEYDPDLREKANHRWFLRERVKFRTVVPMNDIELQQAIHRTFRVQYLRDTLLRPTMDESSLTTLSSLQTFTHADVIKGVTMTSSDTNDSINSTDNGAGVGAKESKDSYLVRVIRKFGIDLYTLQLEDWIDFESSIKNPTSCNAITLKEFVSESVAVKEQLSKPQTCENKAAITVDKHSTNCLPTMWKQHVTPQDDSTTSRRLRRRDALFFLRELFQMVRLSLQQRDRDNFFAVICTLEVDLTSQLSGSNISNNIDDGDIPGPTSQIIYKKQSGRSTVFGDKFTSDSVHSELLKTVVDGDHKSTDNSPSSDGKNVPQSTNLLSLLANLLLDPDAEMSEKGAVLEILAGVAMHDAGLIRRHCLNSTRSWKADHSIRTSLSNIVPEANTMNQVVVFGPPSDLLSAFIFLLTIETDAGILLQVSEIMRIILDTDVMGDQTLLYPGFADEADELVPSVGHNPPHDQHNEPLGGGSGSTNSDQAQFLTVFYEHYAEWLVAPFQHTVVYPIRRIPDRIFRIPQESTLIQSFERKFQQGVRDEDPMLKFVSLCPVRLSFTVELLSFCVRAHLSRMKSFLLKSRVMSNVTQLLRRHLLGVPGDRCLKLAILRFLRAVLSVNDESYHRHIIQNNLFASVFEAFRANPVGDNLVSSAVVEMCDFIQNENIKCLLDYIGRRHLVPSDSQNTSLEDVSSPYVSTLTTLRKAYEANVEETQRLLDSGQSSPGGSRYFPGVTHYSSLTSRFLSGKALEEQRKFREKDEEDSYFDNDDDDFDNGDDIGLNMSSAKRELVVDDTSQQKESDLHRTARMFSLTEAPHMLVNQSDGMHHDIQGNNPAVDSSEVV